MTEEPSGDAVQKVISAMFYRQESQAVQWDGAKKEKQQKWRSVKKSNHGIGEKAILMDEIYY